MSTTTLDVAPLFVVTMLSVPDTHYLKGAPQGSRIVAEVTGGSFEGHRLRGTVHPPGGDWATRRTDRSLKVDARIMLRTEDNAVVLMTYGGIAIPQPGGFLNARIAATFETGDEHYAWLNCIQAVGIGKTSGASVTYDLFELL